MGLLCDKCGHEVPPDNDLAALLMDMGVLDPFAMPSVSRHLLPTPEGCPGSPSRAQYLEGQPRDPRPTYPYCPEDEAPTRAAFTRLLGRARLHAP